MKTYFFILGLFFSGFDLAAQVGEPDQLIGVWKSSEDNLMVKIDKVGNHFQGRIVWIASNSSDAPLLDTKNPEERLREIPLKGNKIIDQLSYDPSKALWSGGTYYHYKEGKSYNCMISLRGSRMEITRYSNSLADGIAETWIRP